jgi:hypothetical protein
VNLEMIHILRETSARCTSSPKELKVLASTEEDPGPWAHNVAVQLARFCERVYRVWRRLDSPPLDKIRFVQTLQSEFRNECSLEFPRDICVADEAIERGEETTRKRKQRKQLSH